MIRIAMVEDDPIYQQQLKRYLDRYQSENGQSFQITSFSSGGAIAYPYPGGFDLILMDIELGGISGMEAAEAIRRVDREVVIVFITNMSQYAMRGYEVEALDYVLKPVSYFAFSQRLGRALERMGRRQERYICISPERGSVHRLAVSALTYVEVREHTLIYHTTRGEIAVPGSMREAERLLDGAGFFRCNKGYLVNLDHVEGMVEGDALVAGERLQISRAKRKPFLDALNNHINEVGK